MIKSLAMMILVLVMGCSDKPADRIDERKVELTAEERAFVSQHRVVTWAVETNRPPFIYTEGVGVYGIAPEVLSVISKKTGLVFKPVLVPSFLDGIESVKNGEIDLMTSIRPTPDRQSFLDFTSPFSYNRGVFMFRQDSVPRSPLIVGIRRGDAAMVYIGGRFPEMKVIEVDDNEEAMALLEKGLLDCAVMNEASADYLAAKSITKMRKANTDYDYPYSFGYKKENIILGRIITKAIDSMSVKDKKAINERWQKETSWQQ